MTVALAFGVSLALLAVRVPVFIALSIGALLAYLTLHTPLPIVSQKFYSGVNSYPLMAVPLFLLSASILEAGGIGRRVVEFGEAIVRGLPAGLALAGLFGCALFAALSGSSVATMASIGGFVIPQMVEAGYSPRFAVGSITAAGTLGMLLPPSIPMILYAVVTENSILALFMAGVVPGLLLLLLLSVASMVAWKLGWAGSGVEQPMSLTERTRRLRVNAPTLLLPLVVFVSIYGIPGVTGGLLTPTEAAVLAVIIALVMTFGVYRAVSLRSMIPMVQDAMGRVGMIMMMIAAASLLGFTVAASGAGADIATWVADLSLGRVGLLLLYNGLLLLVGDFLEAAPVMLIIVPIFYPLAVGAGVDPIQFGVITVVNIEVGTITPPVGINLLTASSVTGMPLYNVFKAALPWIFVVLLVLAVVTFVPEVSLWLPQLLGYS